METRKDGRWHKSPSSNVWFAMDATHTIATIAERDGGIFEIAAAAPNGIGIRVLESNTTLDAVIDNTEQTLRDLGWKIVDGMYVQN